jgi:hypothetical protein
MDRHSVEASEEYGDQLEGINIICERKKGCVGFRTDMAKCCSHIRLNELKPKRSCRRAGIVFDATGANF